MSDLPSAQLPIGTARFVAVSATIPNINDIAAWLRVPPGGLHVFGQEHRPCKLHTIVRGYNMPSKVRLSVMLHLWLSPVHSACAVLSPCC